MSQPIPEPDPYQSARDLPSVAEMLRLLQGGTVLTRFIARGQRTKLVELEVELNEMTEVVDGFYTLLGPRHWIFHESLHFEKTKALLQLEPDAAEGRLIDLYKDPELLRFQVGQLRRFPQLHVRFHLLERAMDDYFAERYDSTVLLLLTVMDGFVNDIEVDQGRRGLHARDESEMVAWDSVVGCGGLAGVLNEATDTERAALYASMGVSAVYNPERNEVRLGVDPVASTVCRRGDLSTGATRLR